MGAPEGPPAVARWRTMTIAASRRRLPRPAARSFRLHNGQALEEALRAEVLRVLPVASQADRGDLEALPTRDMLVAFFNWQSRLVHPHRRRVLRSAALPASLASDDERRAVDTLCAKLAAGIDVHPHLSRRVRCGHAVRPASGKAGPDLDLLLNDWGIHHLHLSAVPEGDGFNGRTARLLFLMVRHGEAYALMVGDHSSWADLDLVAAAVRSWPGAGLFLHVNGILPGSPTASPDIARLRAAGIIAPVVIDGSAYLPGLPLGLSTARTSFRDGRRADEVARWLRLIEADPLPYLEQMREAVAAGGGTWPPRPRLELVWSAGGERYGFALREETTACHMML